MTMGKKKKLWWSGAKFGAACLLFLGTTWTANAEEIVNTEVKKPTNTLFDFAGPPLGTEALQRNRGQGIDVLVSVGPNDTSVIDVILWDEAKRPHIPAPTKGGTANLVSTVNGRPY